MIIYQVLDCLWTVVNSANVMMRLEQIKLQLAMDTIHLN